MILLLVMMQAAKPAELSLQPFYDEKVAATAFEKHVICPGSAAHDRRDDGREAKVIAADIVQACNAEAVELRKQLVEVYQRKADLMPTGLTPSQAADRYVSRLNDRAELVVNEGRKRN